MTLIEALTTGIRDVIQEDMGGRGLRTDPADNLITAWPYDLGAACRLFWDTPRPRLGIVTGFTIPTADPPCGETDGPLGALYLARALQQIVQIDFIATDGTSVAALRAGLSDCGLASAVEVIDLARGDISTDSLTNLTALLALERVGPSHSDGRCYTMRGRDVTEITAPVKAFTARKRKVMTIGIGDGGNEIGMGKLPWDTIRRNIPNGGLIACRVPTDYLIVAGVSNWGAYGLAAGVSLLRGKPLGPELFDLDRERELLQVMVDAGPLVDGKTAQRVAQVDGLTFERYAEPLRRIGEIVASFR
jgi:hypothetical protein